MAANSPFTFIGTIPPNSFWPGALKAIATFPWDNSSFNDLFDGELPKRVSFEEWQAMVATWECAAAIGGKGFLRVQQDIRLKHRPAFVVPLPKEIKSRDVVAVAWALRFNRPTEPLVLFAGGALLYTLNVKTRKVVAILRGHGQVITAIAVHPIYPNYFCTTSKDQTVRIYDFSFKPKSLSAKHGSSAGPLFGQFLEDEGRGFGHCVAVLAGGRSGGHASAVLGAAFHPVHPLLATVGMDRHVKIWRIPTTNELQFVREDKPLFSSSKIHAARVLSVNWLADDILITHSAPAPLRQRDANGDYLRDDDVTYKLYMEEGTVAVWQWLGLNRFLPPGELSPTVLRGCASDYQESSSFTVLSQASLPIDKLHLPVYRGKHPPFVMMLPLENRVRMFMASSLPPEKPVPFAVARQKFDRPINIVRLSGYQETDDTSEKQWAEGVENIIRPRPLTELDGWNLELGGGVDGEQPVTCAMGAGGALLLTIGDRGTLYVHCVNSGQRAGD